MKTLTLNILRKSAYLLLATLFFVLPWVIPALRNYAPGAAVVTGLLFAVCFGNPFAERTARLSSPLLGLAIVMMGFSLNLRSVIATGIHGLGYTFVGIAVAFGVGIFMGRKLNLERDTCLLICSGTAICGGSAIAAVAPVLKAKAHHIAIATAIVFILNAVALLVFPAIGHAFGFSQEQFGLWSAVAIHDTSSVVGASMQYGDRALEVGTTVKLARALWIVPVALLVSLVVGTRDASGKRVGVKVPWFIPGFILAAALVSFLPALSVAGKYIGELSKFVMITTLFLIGSNVSVEKLREVGIRPVIHGVVLWVILLVLWFVVISENWVSVAGAGG